MGTEVACAATASREDLDKDGQRYISNLDQEGLLRRRRDQRLQKEGEVHLVKVGGWGLCHPWQRSHLGLS
jgi:hypothetical protein